MLFFSLLMRIAISPLGTKYLIDRDEINTSEGLIKVSEISNNHVQSSSGTIFTVVEASVPDLFERFKRGAQIITLKDAAYIMGRTGINSESLVVDAGGGSGFMSCFLGLHAKKVVTYEIRKDFIKIIKHNLEFLGLKNIEVKNKDAYLGIDEKDIDVITLDLMEPWLVPTDNLKVGGYLVAYCPTINQVTKVKMVEGFAIEEVCEIMKRDWREDKILRPKSKMIAHTGFIVIMRKL